MSYAILEAMASGLPIIASNVGGNAELVSHGEEGFLYPGSTVMDVAFGRGHSIGNLPIVHHQTIMVGRHVLWIRT